MFPLYLGSLWFLLLVDECDMVPGEKGLMVLRQNENFHHHVVFIYLLDCTAKARAGQQRAVPVTRGVCSITTFFKKLRREQAQTDIA